MKRLTLLLLLLASQVLASGVLTAQLGTGELAVVTLSGEGTAFNDTSGPPWDAFAFIKVDADGNVYEYGGTSASPSYVQVDTVDDWIRPTGAAGVNYEVRATLNSGSLDTGTTGSWLALNSDHEWSVSETVQFASSSANLTLEIRHITLGVLDSNTYTLQASCDL